MSRFTQWSSQAIMAPTIWTKPDRLPATISVMMIPAGLTRCPVEIEAGEPEADIGLDHARIVFPDPFDGHGNLTGKCRTFLITAVQHAMDRDHHLRWIVWADGCLTSCNPVNGRRHRQTSST